MRGRRGDDHGQAVVLVETTHLVRVRVRIRVRVRVRVKGER